MPEQNKDNDIIYPRLRKNEEMLKKPEVLINGSRLPQNHLSNPGEDLGALAGELLNKAGTILNQVYSRHISPALNETRNSVDETLDVWSRKFSGNWKDLKGTIFGAIDEIKENFSKLTDETDLEKKEDLKKVKEDLFTSFRSTGDKLKKGWNKFIK